MGPMDNTKIAPSLAATSKQLDKKLKTDKLSQSLNDDNRPTPQSLKQQGVLPNSVASSLSATAVQLENAQKSDALKQQLTDKDRMPQKELTEKGVLKTNFQATADQLEHQQR